VHPRFGSHHQIFEGTNYKEVSSFEEADFIYISIPHIDGVDQEDPEVFREKVRSVQQQIPVLCVNPDRFATEGAPPRPVVRQGSIAQMFAEEKKDVYLIGKPSKVIFEAALKYIPEMIPKEKIVMIGDTPETDIRGAHGAGLDAVLVTETGIMAHRFAKKEEAKVVASLPQRDRPDFFMNRLNKQ
jgi:ribonucleotide monophosphatase NagD (HAD superfamily)